MVREQDPARNPLMPRQGKVAAARTGDEKMPIEVLSSPPPASISSPAPLFGQPTALNNNASPLAKPSARNAHGEKVIRKSGDTSHSNLFAKKRTGDIGYHKPPSIGNPLFNIGRVGVQQNGPAKSDNPIPSSTRPEYKPRPVTHPEDPFVFQQPTNVLTAYRPPVAPQTFSSNINTNPYFKPAGSFFDPLQPPQVLDDEEGFSDRHVFGNDRFGTVDPMIYVDARTADEDIKALLEGAMDDEDDLPRTRGKKKALDKKVDEMTMQMQGMGVKAEQGSDAQDEEEEEEDEDDGKREGLKVTLLPHQIDGVEWMRGKELGTRKVKGVFPKGGILADDMGLGKTIQSIALILSNPRPPTDQIKQLKRKIDPESDRATLVIAPLALIKQWEAEIRDRIEPDHALKVKVHHGPQRTKSYKDLRNYDVVITTYQTLSSEHADGSSSVKTALFGVNWYRVILDEAHSIKNRNAKTTKAAYALNSEYRWCLTGTPLQNNLDELQSLICFLQIKPYNKLEMWREQITKPMNNGRGGLAIRRLRAFLSAFMKRRTKDVLKQDGGLKTGGNANQKLANAGFKIVKRTVETVNVEFSEREQMFYDRLQDRTDKSLERLMMGGNQVSFASALVLLMRLRQACNHPQLLGGDLSKEQDAVAEFRSPSKKVDKGDDMDDIANMLGGLSVDTKCCDGCGMDLSQSQTAAGDIKCVECVEDLKLIRAPTRKSRDKKVGKKERKTNRRIITDSDDEEDGEESVADHRSQTEDEEEFAESSSDDDHSESGSEDRPRPKGAIPFSSTKIRHLLKILKHDSHTHKYIVFSFFTSMLDLIEPFLTRHNLEFVRYDGAMRNDLREASLEQLRSNSKVRILLCSLRAGSLGLNLTAASRVVVLEPFWNPFVEEQAIDRVHRLNQTQDVVVHKLTIKNSVEERILELQDKKRELANATIEGHKLGAGKLSLQEMLKLFKHDTEKDAKLDMIGMKGGSSLLDRDSQSTSRAPFRQDGAEGRVMPHRQTDKPSKRPEDPVFGRRWN